MREMQDMGVENRVSNNHFYTATYGIGLSKHEVMLEIITREKKSYSSNSQTGEWNYYDEPTTVSGAGFTTAMPMSIYEPTTVSGAGSTAMPTSSYETTTVSGAATYQTGLVTSPNWGQGNYPDNLDKVYPIKVAAGSIIEILFTDFMLEAPDADAKSCIFDWVKVVDGDGTELLGKVLFSKRIIQSDFNLFSPDLWNKQTCCCHQEQYK